jgi:hypothetical protein
MLATKLASTRRFVPRLELLEDRTVLSALTVTSIADSGDGSLRAVIAAAENGDQVVFNDSLRGETITLTSGELALTKSLDIEGPGADQLAISGNHASRIFDISGGVTVTIAGLTITGGRMIGSPGRGGGVLNDSSTLTLAHVVLSDNQALGVTGQAGQGGAIANVSGATLTVTNSVLSHNQAIGGPGASDNGGGIFNTGTASTVAITGTTFLGNQAISSDGGRGGNGGALTNQIGGPTATIRHSTFIGNQAMGGDGAVAGPGTAGFNRGGAIYNNTATLRIEDSTFTGNEAIGGSGGSAGSSSTSLGVGNGAGGGVFNADQGILFVTGSAFTGNQALGGSNNTGGNAPFENQIGTAIGGGLFNVGVGTVTESNFEDNEARGGSGNRGGTGFSLVGTATGGAIATAATNPSYAIRRKNDHGIRTYVDFSQ